MGSLKNKLLARGWIAISFYAAKKVLTWLLVVRCTIQRLRQKSFITALNKDFLVMRVKYSLEQRTAKTSYASTTSFTNPAILVGCSPWLQTRNEGKWADSFVRTTARINGCSISRKNMNRDTSCQVNRSPIHPQEYDGRGFSLAPSLVSKWM